MNRWQILWFTLLIVGAGLFVVGLFVAIAYRKDSELGNIASIWGVCVGIIGFFLTIYTLWDTQRVTREAEAAIKKAAADAELAVQKAQDQTRQVLGKTAMILLVSELENLRRLVVAM